MARVYLVVVLSLLVQGFLFATAMYGVMWLLSGEVRISYLQFLSIILPVWVGGILLMKAVERAREKKSGDRSLR